MGAVLVLISVVLFVIAAIGKASLGEFSTVALGLAFFAASFLVGPAVGLYNRNRG